MIVVPVRVHQIPDWFRRELADLADDCPRIGRIHARIDEQRVLVVDDDEHVRLGAALIGPHETVDAVRHLDERIRIRGWLRVDRCTDAERRRCVTTAREKRFRFMTPHPRVPQRAAIRESDSSTSLARGLAGLVCPRLFPYYGGVQAGRGRGIATASILLLALLSTIVPREAVRASQTSPRKIVLVGIDAADWLAIDPLIRAGKLPTFARLRSRGRTGVMLSTPPLISPMIWTTVATGVEPENHGILDFTADLPNGRQVPVGSSQRLAPALWNLFSQAGRRVAIVGWWATWPAEQVNGTIVSDALAPQLIRSDARSDKWLLSPASIEPRVMSRLVRAGSVTVGDLSAYVPVTAAQHASISEPRSAGAGKLYSDPIAHLAAIVAGTRTYDAVVQDFVQTDRPDFVAVYLEAVDTVSHLFINADRRESGSRETDRRGSNPRDASRSNSSRAIGRAYEEVDDIMRRLAESSPSDALVIVCSDHGFYPATAGVVESASDLTGPATAWHRPYGIVGVASAGLLVSDRLDDRVDAAASLGIVTPLDMAPTVLHAAGLAVPADMPGRVVREMLPAESRARQPQRVAPQPFTRVAMPDAVRSDSDDAVARLQALGYVGASRTSLARQNLGESLLRRGKLEAAERELRSVLEVQPQNLSANLWLAQALSRQKRAAAAIAVYERVVALPGGAREALSPAVDLAIGEKDLSAAERLISTGERYLGASDRAAQRLARAAVLVARGSLAEARGDVKHAETSYRSALDADPLSFDAAARLFELIAGAGRTKEALPVVERAALAAPDSPRHLALVGEARLAARDAAGAEKALRRALELVPDGDAVRVTLGRALVAQGKADDAIGVVMAAAPSADRDVVMGAAYAAKRDYSRVVQHLQSALERGRATPDVLNGLGYACVQLGRSQEAARMFERSLAMMSNQPEIRKLLAEIRKDPDEVPSA